MENALKKVNYCVAWTGPIFLVTFLFSWVVLGHNFPAPLTFLPYFKTGPFAINGWWAFHGVVVGFGTTMATFTHYMFKEIRRTRLLATLPVGQAIRN